MGGIPFSCCVLILVTLFQTSQGKRQFFLGKVSTAKFLWENDKSFLLLANIWQTSDFAKTAGMTL